MPGMVCSNSASEGPVPGALGGNSAVAARSTSSIALVRRSSWLTSPSTAPSNNIPPRLRFGGAQLSVKTDPAPTEVENYRGRNKRGAGGPDSVPVRCEPIILQVLLAVGVTQAVRRRWWRRTWRRAVRRRRGLFVVGVDELCRHRDSALGPGHLVLIT